MVSWTTEFESEWPIWRGDIGVCASAKNHRTRKVQLISKYFPTRIVAVYCNFQQLYALRGEGEEKKNMTSKNGVWILHSDFKHTRCTCKKKEILSPCNVSFLGDAVESEIDQNRFHVFSERNFQSICFPPSGPDHSKFS